MYKNFYIIALSLIASFLLTGCNFNKSESSEEQAVIVDPQGNSDLRKAPSFAINTIDGERISLKRSMVENKPTVIYFTASWCPMCAKNWPALSEVYPEYKDRINMVTISIDPTDDEEVMKRLDEKHDFQFPVAAGDPQVMLSFGVDSQATTVGINKEGYVEFQKDKMVLTAEEYRALFDQLLD